MKDIFKFNLEDPKNKGLEKRFSYTTVGILNILESMLEFNPFFRPTARELINNPIFNKIRTSYAEKKAEHKIVIDHD